jgi:hypothetical protein
MRKFGSAERSEIPDPHVLHEASPIDYLEINQVREDMSESSVSTFSSFPWARESPGDLRGAEEESFIDGRP